jgi:tetratricopeptide (TPR) repeat protein
VTAAEGVIDASLDTLDSLVAKQLLVRSDDRLAMLDTVREYALERLVEHADADAVRKRLAAWCLGFAREATPHLVRADRIPWLAQLDAELPNILAALSWALEHQDAELALQLATELGAYWWRSSRWEDGLPWIDAALKHGHDASVDVRAKAHLYRARLASVRQLDRYRVDLQASLRLFRACDDAAGITACLGHLVDVEAWHGRCENAVALSDEAMLFAERAHDEEAIAWVLRHRAFAATTYDETASRTRTAIEHLRQVGNLNDVADICTSTGYLAIVERRYQDALAWLAEGLDAGRQLGRPNFVFLIRTNQGLAMLLLDEIDEAAQAFSDALAVCRDAGCETVIDETLLCLAVVAARRGELARAARIAGAAERHRVGTLAHREIVIMSRLDAMLTAPRESYGPDNWDHARKDGASLTVYDAIDLALKRGRFAPTAPDNPAPSPT